MAREDANMNHIISVVASDVAQKLATSRVIGSSAYITTPLTYVGGSPVVVRLDQHGNKFFVSDAGFGAREAELIGGIRAYQKVAEGIAIRFGIKFDMQAFFEAEVGSDDLVPAVIAIANASRSAVDMTAYRMAEKAANDARLVMREKLLSAFTPAMITTGFTLRGGSNDEWDFDAAVRRDDHIALFQVITPAQQSVVSAAARFMDISDLPDDRRPSLVGVLQDRAKTPRLKLIQRSAFTIDMIAEPSVWQQAAA
jgi:hypothetical protein